MTNSLEGGGAMSDGMRLWKTRTGVIDRRGARRYKLNWVVKVIAQNPAGESGQIAILRNLSSTGALACMKTSAFLGQRLLVFFRLPIEEEIWMRYSATVVRVSAEPGGAGVAFKFDNSRPEFERTRVDLASRSPYSDNTDSPISCRCAARPWPKVLYSTAPPGTCPVF